MAILSIYGLFEKLTQMCCFHLNRTFQKRVMMFENFLHCKNGSFASQLFHTIYSAQTLKSKKKFSMNLHESTQKEIIQPVSVDLDILEYLVSG